MGTGFRQRSCSTNKLERDDDPKKSHHALAPRHRGFDRWVEVSRMGSFSGGNQNLDAAWHMGLVSEESLHVRARGHRVDRRGRQRLYHAGPDVLRSTCLVPLDCHTTASQPAAMTAPSRQISVGKARSKRRRTIPATFRHPRSELDRRSVSCLISPDQLCRIDHPRQGHRYLADTHSPQGRLIDL